jgi:hypothetical protein
VPVDQQQPQHRQDVALRGGAEVGAGPATGAEEVAVAVEQVERVGGQWTDDLGRDGDLVALQGRDGLRGVLEHPLERRPVLAVDQVGEQRPGPCPAVPRLQLVQPGPHAARHGHDGLLPRRFQPGEHRGDETVVTAPVAPLRGRAERGHLTDRRQRGGGWELLCAPGAPARGGRRDEPAQLAESGRGEPGQRVERTPGGLGRELRPDLGDLLRGRTGDDDAAAVGHEPCDGVGQLGDAEPVEDDEGVAAHGRDDRAGVLAGVPGQRRLRGERRG